jgi:enamine deaminase RidA (YjgF/YER057c/UK114 family)
MAGSLITIGGTAGVNPVSGAMNTAYVEKMGDHRPARTVIGVRELPKPGVLLTMNLTAVTAD